MRNEITIRTADNGYTVTAYSSNPVIAAQLEGSRFRYTVHTDTDSVVCAVEKVLEIIKSALDG